MLKKLSKRLHSNPIYRYDPLLFSDMLPKALIVREAALRKEDPKRTRLNHHNACLHLRPFLIERPIERSSRSNYRLTLGHAQIETNDSLVRYRNTVFEHSDVFVLQDHVRDWCYDNLIDWWDYAGNHATEFEIWFESKRDAMMFKIKWL